MMKNCDLSLEMLPSLYSLGQYFQDLGHSFSPCGPPSQQIIYMSWTSLVLKTVVLALAAIDFMSKKRLN